MSLTSRFREGEKETPKEPITSLEFYGVYCGPDGKVRALKCINSKTISLYNHNEIEELLEPNLVSISNDPKLDTDLYGICIDAKAECILANSLELPKTGGLYMRVKDDVYTLQTWPLKLIPYQPS